MALVLFLAVVWALSWLLWRAYSVVQTPNDILVDKLGLDIPPAPEVTLEDISAREVRLTWKQPDQLNSTHKHVVEVNGVKVGDVKRTETAVSILDLQPSTHYDIRIFTVSGAGFQTPSYSIRVRTSAYAKGEGEAAHQDVHPRIQAYTPRSIATVPFPSAPAMAREQSGGQMQARRGTVGRKLSPASLTPEAPLIGHGDEDNSSSTDEGSEDLAQLSERFQKIQQDNEAVECQILGEEAEFEASFKQLEAQRDEVKDKFKKRDEQSNDLRRQVHKLESQSRAAQSDRSKKERQLQQKENQHKKRRDDIAMWDDRITSMTDEIGAIKSQQAAMERRTASEIQEIRQRIEEEQKEVQSLDEENKEKAIQIKALEEERARLNEEEETEESREADRLDRERDGYWKEKLRNLHMTYSNLHQAIGQAKQQYDIARERLNWYENARRMGTATAYSPVAPLDLDIIRKGVKPWRNRQRGSLTGSISSPLGQYPSTDSFAPSAAVNSTSNTSPSFTGPAYLNLQNGMTFVAPSDKPAPLLEEVEFLTSGASMSPRADALLPANLLGEESADEGTDEDMPMPTQPATRDLKLLAFAGIGSLQLPNDPQNSPSPVSSSNRSFSSPRASLTNPLESDRASLQSGQIEADQAGSAENPQTASRKLGGLFTFSRQRGKTMADEPPMLGTLKPGQSQSFPRNIGTVLDPLAAQRRRRGYTGNWAFPKASFRSSNVKEQSEADRLASTRRGFPNPFSGLGRSSDPAAVAYDPFSSRNNPLDPSSLAGGRGESLSSRPSSIYSFDNLPRPSMESQFHAWGPQDRSNLRGSPLAPDWGSSHTWSRSQSRRPSVQFGSTGNLSLAAPPEEDFLEPPREPQRPLQAPIGTRPTSSQRTTTPRLNPAAPSFTTRFFSQKAEKNKDKDKTKIRGGERSTPDLGAEDASPPDSRKSKDTQSLLTNGSTAESHEESLERTTSTQSGGTAPDMTPSKETFIHKLITRKSSSSKFNSWKEKGGLFSSRRNDSPTPGDIDEDGTSSEQPAPKGPESTSTTPGAERDKEERPKANRSSLGWSFMRKSKKGGGFREDLTASEEETEEEKEV